MIEQHYPTPDFGLSLHRMYLSLLCFVSLFFLLVRAALKLRSLHLPPLRLCRIAVFSIKSTLHLTVCDVSVCASVIVQNIRCFEYRKLHTSRHYPLLSQTEQSCHLQSLRPMQHLRRFRARLD